MSDCQPPEGCCGPKDWDELTHDETFDTFALAERMGVEVPSDYYSPESEFQSDFGVTVIKYIMDQEQICENLRIGFSSDGSEVRLGSDSSLAVLRD